MIFVAFVLYAMCSSAAFVEPHRRSKRIVFGEPLPSLDTYKTYFFVEIRRSWACLTDQTNHNLLNRCQEDYHKCGGALVHPEFVLTAAHCVMYYDVFLMTKGGKPDTFIWTPNTQNSDTDLWEKIEYWFRGLIVVPKPKHVVYSDWALLVGSHDFFKMKQKRHVAKVFPHSQFPKKLRTKVSRDKLTREANGYHDIALLRACLPFNIKLGEVELAPMLNTVDELREQYERIVRTSMQCLYIGFGRQDNDQNEARTFGWPVHNRNLLLHTWRTSMCYSACNRHQLRKGVKPHPCFLCSWHHGAKLGVAQKGDSGGPIICERYFVASITRGILNVKKNISVTSSYPLHCVKDAISQERLDYYKTVGTEYHPLRTRLRRLPLPPE